MIRSLFHFAVEFNQVRSEVSSASLAGDRRRVRPVSSSGMSAGNAGRCCPFDGRFYRPYDDCCCSLAATAQRSAPHTPQRCSSHPLGIFPTLDENFRRSDSTNAGQCGNCCSNNRHSWRPWATLICGACRWNAGNFVPWSAMSVSFGDMPMHKPAWLVVSRRMSDSDWDCPCSTGCRHVRWLQSQITQ